jgi:hypothetical protein
LISEEYRGHQCNESLKSVKIIGVNYEVGSAIDRNGDKIKMFKSVDGILVKLVFCEHQIPLNLPHQPTLNTNNDQSENEQNPNTETLNTCVL